jgi:hypothetical protein
MAKIGFSWLQEMEIFMEEEVKNKIIGLKAEVYELIKQQELLVLKNNEIQELKLRKVQEIQRLEEQYKTVPWANMV